MPVRNVLTCEKARRSKVGSPTTMIPPLQVKARFSRLAEPGLRHSLDHAGGRSARARVSRRA
jgi:hypothetical protein